MLEKEPSFFVESAGEQKEGDPKPYDAVISLKKSKEKVGFVRDNFVCQVVNDKGQETTIRIPASITYFKNLHSGEWYKKLYGYQEGVEEALGSGSMDYYVVFDPSSELSFLAMPLTDKTYISRGRDSLASFLEYGRKEDSDSLNKFLSEFKGIGFGLFGSRSFENLIPARKQDIDLVIYGPKDLQKVVLAIEEDWDLCQRIGITRPSAAKIERDTEHYMRKFNFTETEARIMATRRRRYVLKPDIRLSFNCALPAEGLKRKIPFVIGSRKIHDVTIEATAIDVALSSSLPRTISVENEGQQMDVVTSVWSLKDFIRPGDKVKIKGALRESKGMTFISLERPDHIIKPIVGE